MEAEVFYINYSILPYRCRKWRHRIKAKFVFAADDLRSLAVVAAIAKDGSYQTMTRNKAIALHVIAQAYPKYREVQFHGIEVRRKDIT